MERKDGKLNLEEKLTASEIADIRTRCAELIFTGGSIEQKKDLTKSCSEMYSFIVDQKQSA